MAWLDDIISNLQSGGAPAPFSPAASPFPDIPQTPTPEQEAAAAAAAREAAGQRLIRANQRRINPFGVPDQNSAGIQLAMDQAPAGTGVPGPAGNAPPVQGASVPFGIPPSLQLASKVAAPPPAPTGPQMTPQPPITGLGAPIGGMGRPAPPAAPADDGDTTPPNATPTQGHAPMSLAGPGSVAPADEPSFLQKLAAGAKAISPALLGVGAALQGDQGHLTTSILKDREALAQQNETQNLTAKALIAKGVDPATVAAAVKQPELLKALIADQFGKSKYKLETIAKDEFGGEQKAFVNQNDPTDQLSVDGKKITPGTSALPVGTSNSAYLAKGVTAINHDLAGDAYLQQYSPEMQTAAKDYLAGRATPVGNPRKGWAENVIKVAKKYGADIGMPADDSSFAQRKAFGVSLADTKSGVGLQAKGFQQGLEHFVKLSDTLVKMNLSNGLGLEPLAGLVNSAKNLTTDQQELVHNADVKGQALSREMGNLFSKNGGGVHEAAETKKAVSNSTMSSKAAAGSLEAIDELMQGGLKALEQRRDELFPNGDAPKGAKFLGPDQQAALEHIRKNIAILKGEQSAAPTPTPIASKADYDALPKGKPYIAPDGSHRIKQ